MYDLNGQKLQKLTGNFGLEQEKSLTNMSVGASKFYSFATKTGSIYIMGQDSKKLLFDLKMNGACTGVAFNRDESVMYSVGD
jgi:hypothetical protein